MDLISLLLTLAVVGFLAWVIITYIPMPDLFKNVIVVVMVIAVVLYLVKFFKVNIAL